MKLRTWFPPAAALVCAVSLAAPRPLPAFTTLAGPLPLDLRSVRVFDNFSDPEANANAALHPSFPGFSGAELAIWKAAVEWGSGLHADGQGDPTQPYGLGSGGANFDFVWQGNATDIGGTDDNVVSELGSSGLGVLAFTELPTDDGWRIRFHRFPWTWHDDPTGNYVQTPTAADLQAIATHEFGHALGLDHTPVAGATMSAQIPFPNVPLRTIEADDIAGVQFLYGVKAPDKPVIHSYRLLARGGLEILGEHFDPFSNEVWFTPAQPTRGAGGAKPVIVRGARPQAADSRSMLLRIPAAAGPGDIVVRRPGSAASNLSNAFPFSPLHGPPCPGPASYGVGKTTSLGTVAQLDFTGSPSFATQDLVLQVFGLPANVAGELFVGLQATELPFLGGSLLVAPPFRRGAPFQTDFIGFAALPFPVPAELVDEERFVQAWFLDPNDPAGAGTTNALSLPFCP